MNDPNLQTKKSNSRKKNSPKSPNQIRPATKEDLEKLPLFKNAGEDLIDLFLGIDQGATEKCSKKIYKSYVCDLKEKQKLSLVRNGRENIYSIVEGHFSLTLPTSFKTKKTNAEYFIAWRGPEQIVGEMSPLAGEPHSVNITALTECILVEIPSDLFMKVADNNAILYKNLAELIIKKEFSNRRHADLLQNVSEGLQKVVYTLLLLCKVRGCTENENNHLIINGIVKQRDIAGYLGCERQNVTPHMKQLREMRIADYTGSGTNNAKVTILDYDRLYKMAPETLNGEKLEI